MSVSEIRVEDHSDEFVQKFGAACLRGLTKIGMQAEKFAKQHITEQKAIDTGRLRNSITYLITGMNTHVSSYTGNNGESGGEYSLGTIGSIEDKAVYIGSNVEYAPYVEFGTGRRAEVGMGGNPTRPGMRPRPYLRPAATQHGSTYQKFFTSEFTNL